MRIRELTLRNYRGIGDAKTFVFKETFTLIAGVNGKGKTAVLEALALLLSRLLPQISPSRSGYRRVLPAELHTGSTTAQLSVSVNCAGIPIDFSVGCELGEAARPDHSKTVNISQTSLSAQLRRSVKMAYGDPKRADDAAPMVVYYTTDRAGFRFPRTLPARLPSGQAAAYQGALSNRTVNFADFCARFRSGLALKLERTFDPLEAHTKSQTIATAVVFCQGPTRYLIGAFTQLHDETREARYVGISVWQFDSSQLHTLFALPEDTPGPIQDVRHLVCASSGQRALLVSSDSDGRTVVWDLETKEIVKRFYQPHGMSGMALIGDRQDSLLTSSPSGELMIWPLALEQQLTGTPSQHPGRVSALWAGRVGEQGIAVSAGEGLLCLWNTAGLVRIGEAIQTTQSDITSLTVAEFNGRQTLIVGGDHVEFYDIQTHTPLGDPLRNSPYDVADMLVKQLGGSDVLVVAYNLKRSFPGALSKGVVRVWNLNTGQVIRDIATYDAEITALASLPDVADPNIAVSLWTGQFHSIQLETEIPSSNTFIGERAVRSFSRVVASFLGDVSNIRIATNPVRLLVDKAGETLDLSQLSDGERAYFALAADLVRRLSLANPGYENPLLGAGVVLIDELELHLHPKWQLEIVERLRSTFPHVQFIATTHSPFILQTAREGEVISLDRGLLIEPAGHSLEEVARLVMDVTNTERSPRYQEMLTSGRRYLELVEEARNAVSGRRAEIQRELVSLLAPFSDNPAYTALLERRGDIEAGPNE